MAITSAQVSLVNKMNRIAKKVGLGTLISGLTGSHYILAAGVFTSAGGDATESITVTGATSSDVAIVTLKTKGASPVTILAAAPTTNAITVTMSADPSTDHVLSYVVLRVVA